MSENDIVAEWMAIILILMLSVAVLFAANGVYREPDPLVLNSR